MLPTFQTEGDAILAGRPTSARGSTEILVKL